jgi:hypothetical protein
LLIAPQPKPTTPVKPDAPQPEFGFGGPVAGPNLSEIMPDILADISEGKG